MDTPQPPPGLARLFDKQGLLVNMPVKRALRRELLTWVASTLPMDRDLDEIEMNRQLRPIHSDVAMLRRYLIDEGLVERPEPGTYRVSYVTC